MGGESLPRTEVSLSLLTYGERVCYRTIPGFHDPGYLFRISKSSVGKAKYA